MTYKVDDMSKIFKMMKLWDLFFLIMP